MNKPFAQRALIITLPPSASLLPMRRRLRYGIRERHRSCSVASISASMPAPLVIQPLMKNGMKT